MSTVPQNRPEYNRFTTGNFSLDEMVTTPNFIIFIFELFLCFIAFFINLMFITIISNTTTLHKNLRILLISNCVADAIYAISRYMILVPLIVSYLFNIEITTITYCWLAKSLHHWVLGASGLSFFVLVMERSLASFLYQSYETQSCYQSGFILTGFQWSYGLLIVVANQLDLMGTPRIYPRLPCQIEYSTARAIGVFVAAGFCLNIVAVLTFRKMVKFNRTLFRQRSFKLTSLTEIYQISENVKSISLLVPVIVVMIISNIVSTLTISVNVIVYIFVRETPESQRISVMTLVTGRGNEISQIYDICAVLCKIAFCWAIRSHPDLHKKWKSLFGNSKIGPKADRPNLDVMGLDGKKLTFTVIEETQHHFDSLAEIWK
ncbi:hypothetical protein L3Y34_016953 [Caenorhabditis briggsae]|uniref:G-protein coupled receptors family 1 profile domain-containing protein n=1 Tax=Caenorhabditis briggsae TaxID=6238 RepID=A0AAE9DG76_CAEBR|nr:hypothetical protein L3Y34_016953 [Caenorhabditis briggsae]